MVALLILAVALSFLPVSSLAAVKSAFYYAGWIPYWRRAAGVQDFTLHIERLNEISPFSYEIKSDGTLVDKLKIGSEDFWASWLKAIHDFGIKIIPTVATGDGDTVHYLLSNKKRRLAHINQILALVKLPNFDGIDIDYENKKSETKNYFSLFIKELAQKLHARHKILTCTIEPRAPIESFLAKGVPRNEIKRANDYTVLNRYCDEIRLMAYDQGIIDPLLDKEKGTGQVYAPVADPDWVKKVLKETTGEIKRRKIMLGIPTYGYEYEITQNGTSTEYRRIRSLTYKKSVLLAANLGVVPERNSAGELSFTYTTSSAFSSDPNITSTHLVWFSDAGAAVDKIKLAKKYNLKGVIFFKIDGEDDPSLWEKLKQKID